MGSDPALLGRVAETKTLLELVFEHQTRVTTRRAKDCHDKPQQKKQKAPKSAVVVPKWQHISGLLYCKTSKRNTARRCCVGAGARPPSRSAVLAWRSIRQCPTCLAGFCSPATSCLSDLSDKFLAAPPSPFSSPSHPLPS